VLSYFGVTGAGGRDSNGDSNQPTGNNASKKGAATTAWPSRLFV
jgi:hypothetical protein